MLSETEVIVRATRSRVASVPGELSFSVGDVIVYLPQRGRSGATGMAMGRLGAGEGLFPPSFTELANDSSVSAPAAHPLALEPDAGGASSAIDQQRGMPILPQGRQSLRLAVWDVFNDPESCKAAQVVMIWVMSLIIISTIAFVAESMPEFHVRGGPGAVSSQNARQISLLLSLLPQSLTLIAPDSGLADPTWPEFWDTMETVIVLQAPRPCPNAVANRRPLRPRRCSPHPFALAVLSGVLGSARRLLFVRCLVLRRCRPFHHRAHERRRSGKLHRHTGSPCAPRVRATTRVAIVRRWRSCRGISSC